MYFKVRLADLVIGVECLYETTRMFCKDYVSEDMPVDFEVKITDEDIRNERKISDDTERKKRIMRMFKYWIRKYGKMRIIIGINIWRRWLFYVR